MKIAVDSKEKRCSSKWVVPEANLASAAPVMFADDDSVDEKKEVMRDLTMISDE